jgi:uncharacterized hydrophobic protein (TIGR00271 family)
LGWHQNILNTIKQHFSLELEEDFATSYAEVKAGAEFKGYNLWILCIAMVIASIGLSTNSSSAVVGAMLISPLMGPVVGYAFALAINDDALRRMSLKNWLLMTVVSICSATLFFLINPFHKYTDQLHAFDRATVFDILLALFGGLAGLIGIVKRDGAKILAGVAVATACMPPLCTSAHGLVHLDWQETLGGLYFYLINCLFIGVASFLVTRYLGFQNATHSSARKRNPITAVIWYVSITLMLLPGCIIAWQKWQQEYRAPQTASETTEQKLQRLEARVAVLDSMVKAADKP